MKYYIVDAFTGLPFGGNPAGVVLLSGDSFPDEELMLKVAAELRYSETAFVRILSPREYHVRYFTPKAEVELCGHATIATFSLLHQMQLAKGECLCHTLAGDLRIEVGEKVMMQMAIPRIVATVEDTDEIYKAIGVTGYQPPLPVQIAYSGLPDIMIPVTDVATLNGLCPNMETVSAITQKQKAVSFHVFALSCHQRCHPFSRRLRFPSRRGHGETFCGGNTHLHRWKYLCRRHRLCARFGGI